MGVGQRETQMVYKNGRWVVDKICNNRTTTVKEPREITAFIKSYMPLDKMYKATWQGKNIFGWTIHERTLQSGKVYLAYDGGKRLVVEVGCNTVTFIQINSENKSTHHRFFIQPTHDFFSDITDRLLAAQVVKKTAMIVTIAKYEMYFLMGMFSTVSIPMWLIITGTDVTMTVNNNFRKVKAFEKLAKELEAELNKIKQYAPTLHSKITDYISNEKNTAFSRTAKQIPNSLLTDEKTKGQVTGILYGKYAMSSNAFTLKLALFTILLQVAIKSTTNSADAYASVLKSRYSPLIKSLQAVDWNNPQELLRANKQFQKLLIESGINVSEKESAAILTEISSNPDKVKDSATNMNNAYNEFINSMK